MSPFFISFEASSGVKTILATPAPMLRLPAAIPFATTFISTGRSGNTGLLRASAGGSFFFKLQTVSGLDCTM